MFNLILYAFLEHQNHETVRKKILADKIYETEFKKETLIKEILIPYFDTFRLKSSGKSVR